MSQNVIIGILGVIIVAGGGVWYYQTNMADDSSAASNRSSSAREADDKGGVLDSITGGAKSLTDLLSGGDALECRFAGTDPETGEYSEGTIFIDGENFRADGEWTVDGEMTAFNMIQHERVMYMWSEDDPSGQGVKIDMSMFPEEEGGAPESPIDWLKDPEAGVEFDCKGWSPRSNAFEPPKDVEFIDMFGAMGAMFGQMMQEGMGEMGGMEDMPAYDDNPSADDWSY